MAEHSGTERRAAVARVLEEAAGPVSAASLARQFSVSRQIIVGDIALLRAGGAGILATPRGYVLERCQEGAVHTVACIHTPEQMEAELTAIVDAGGEVVDVIVEHPVYGQLTGILGLRSRYDIGEFIRRVTQHGARPLSDLTGGIHLHTIRCRDEKSFQRVQKALTNEGFLLDM